MKKVFLIPILLAGIFMMSTFASAGIWYPTHAPAGANVVLTLDLVQKDSTDWSVVNNGATGEIDGIKKVEWKKVNGKYGYYPYYVMRIGGGYRLTPTTSYTLIYYGKDAVNDVWPSATCIASVKTDRKGRLGISSWSRFDWKSMENDGVNQKFWIVPSSDVNCAQGKLTAWNPTKYLFETETI